MTDRLRYKVLGAAVAGAQPGEIVAADPDDVDVYGRHLINDQRVLLAAAVAGGVLEPQSKPATEAATEPGRG